MIISFTFTFVCFILVIGGKFKKKYPSNITLYKIHLSSVIFSHYFMNQLRRPPTGISEPFHFKSFSPFTLKRTYQSLFQWPCTPVVIAISAVVVATVKRPNGDLWSIEYDLLLKFLELSL